MRLRKAIRQSVDNKIHNELAGMNVDDVMMQVLEFINMSRIILNEVVLMPQLVILRDMADRIDVEEVKRIVRYSIHDKKRLERETKMLEAGEAEKP